MVATAPLPSVPRPVDGPPVDGPAVQRWLWCVWGLILLMVVVGGITRLTESGLSMVVWQPLIGALPPLNEADWLAVFEQYKQTPQYQQVNQWMTLADFKQIFFWEYVHRLLGRFIGIAVMVPGIWFLIRRRLSGPTAVKVLLAFVFGGLQGLMGWYMVKSGLVDVPAVSHYRLAAHLGLAFFVGCWILWILLDIRRAPTRARQPLRGLALGFLALLTLQIIYGAFMAGSRAGYLFATWPDMHGVHWPPGADLGWPGITSNPWTIHALHRHLAWGVLALGALLTWRGLKTATDRGQRRAAHSLGGLLVVQFALGVATVMTSVHIVLATAHQGVAFLLLCATVWVVHAARGRA